MTLTRRQRYDYRDIDRHELLLIRVGHHLWRDRRKFRGDVLESEAIWKALETVWEIKRKYRMALKERLSAKAAKIKTYFADKKALNSKTS